MSKRPTEYVSASRLKLWLKCPHAYKLTYEDGLPTGSSKALFLGRMVHFGLQHFYEYRKRDVTLYPEYLGAYILRNWKPALENEFVEFESRAEEEELQDQAVKLLGAYIAQVPKDEPRPIIVEERLEAALIDPTTGEDLGIALVGIVDLVLDGKDGPIISDFKTASRSSKQLDIIHEIQLSCYSYLFREVTGKTESGLEIRSLIKTKTPKCETHRYPPRRETHYRRLFNVIRAYLEAVRTGNYWINPGFDCSYCDHRETCQEGLVQLAA